MQRYRKQQNKQLPRRRGRDKEGAGRGRGGGGGNKTTSCFLHDPRESSCEVVGFKGLNLGAVDKSKTVCIYNGLQNNSIKAISSTPSIFAPCSNFSFKALTWWKLLLFKLDRAGGVRVWNRFVISSCFPDLSLFLKTFIFPLTHQGELADLLLSLSKPQKNLYKRNKILPILINAKITRLPTAFQLFLQNPDT